VRWTIAIASPIGALIANQAIPNRLFPTPFFLSAVMMTAHFSGMRAGLLAFLLSFAFLDYFYIPPFGTLAIDADAVAALAQFIVPAVMGVWFIHKRKEVELLLARETAIAKRPQGEQTPADLGWAVLEYLAPELGAPIASFYEISCCNVMIYFDRVLQERALGLFDDSLCWRGFLGIGARESLRLTSHERSFTELSERWYRRC
jgi:hypothetical protein